MNHSRQLVLELTLLAVILFVAGVGEASEPDPEAVAAWLRASEAWSVPGWVEQEGRDRGERQAAGPRGRFTRLSASPRRRVGSF
jgi:hypothetical protein